MHQSSFEIEFSKKFNKALRLKKLKELEDEYSKEIVALYKEQEAQKKENVKYKEMVIIIIF